MIVHEFEIVIFTQFGGFCLTKEMATWLQEHKGWTVAEDQKQTDEHLVSLDDRYFYPNSKRWRDSDYVDLRMNADFIECVKTLQAKYKDVGHRCKDEDIRQLLGMSIREVSVFVEVNNVHDGKENLVVTGVC